MNREKIVKAVVLAWCCVALWLIVPNWVWGSSGVNREIAQASERDGLGLARVGEREVNYFSLNRWGLAPLFKTQKSDAYGGISQNGDRIVGYSHRHMAVMDLMGRTIWESRDSFHGGSLQLSPDGRMIAFQDEDSLFIKTIANDQNRTVLSPTKTLRGMVWSPDASHIAFEQNGAIKLYDLLSGSMEVVGAGYEPTWSPDGNTISFRADDQLGCGILIDAHTHRESGFPKMHEIVGSIRWSPDSQYILYADLRGSLMSQLLTIGGLAQVNGRMAVRRVRDGAEWTLIDGGPSGYPTQYQWVNLREVKK